METDANIKCNFNLSLKLHLTFHHLLQAQSSLNIPFPNLPGILEYNSASSYRGVYKVGVQKSFELCMSVRIKHHRDCWGRNLLIPVHAFSWKEHLKWRSSGLWVVSDSLEEGTAHTGLFLWDKPTGSCRYSELFLYTSCITGSQWLLGDGKERARGRVRKEYRMLSEVMDMFIALIFIW